MRPRRDQPTPFSWLQGPFDLLSAGRFHITVIAALGTFTFAWLFTGQYQWLLTLAAAVDWFVVNMTIGLLTSGRTKPTGSREQICQSHRRLLLWWAYAVWPRPWRRSTSSIRP